MVFIISVFEKTGRISDVSWALIILAVTGLGIETKDVISQPFKSFRIWLGAVKNYLIVYIPYCLVARSWGHLHQN